MPPSSTTNVVRYTALLSGLAYGIIHRRSLQKEKNKKEVEHEYQKKEQWVQDAKKEWQRLQAQKLGGGDGVVTDPNAPNFDLEKFLEKLDRESK